MIRRRHRAGAVRSEAVYSDCGLYRYRLSRRWGAGGVVNFVMLNPSTADERANDPTVERCERRARAMGFAGFCVTNLFAYRATDPRVMRRAPDPVGPGNDAVVLRAARQADRVVAAWGTHGAHLGRGPAVARLLGARGIALHHLGLSQAGHPRHPLYLPYDRQPEAWELTPD